MTFLFYALEKREHPNALSARLAAKLVAFILALTLVMGLLMCGVDHAFAAPFVKDEVIIKSDNIKLGDVFDGVKKHADFVLAPAPQPGQDLTWNQATLLRIATAFDLPWRPDADETVHIKRAGAVIDTDTIRAVIRDHLAGVDGSADYNVRFDGPSPQIVLTGDTAPQVELVDFNMNPHGGTFSAIVRASVEGGSEQTINLRGVADRMVRLPVLRTGMHNGQIIGPADITYITARAFDVRPGAVTDAQGLIGSTPRRDVYAGQVVRMDDLEMPRLISRGDLVTMIFSQNGMMLTAKGKALEDGSMGDQIKVSNTNSNRMIEARVTNTKEVTVSQ